MISNWFEITHLESKVCVKTVLNDANNESHHKANAAVRNENDPKELVKQPKVGLALENKSPVCKPYQDCPEYEAEERSVAEEN